MSCGSDVVEDEWCVLVRLGFVETGVGRVKDPLGVAEIFETDVSPLKEWEWWNAGLTLSNCKESKDGNLIGVLMSRGFSCGCLASCTGDTGSE